MTAEALAQRLGELLSGRDLTIAVAESLTGGQLASELARATDASTWFRGGVVAYASEVKYDLLDVPRGPVVSQPAAAAMASSVAERLGADIGASVTGVGGPDPQDGQPPGTVWMAVWSANRAQERLVHFDGDPATVCAKTCETALALVLEHLDQVGGEQTDQLTNSA
ncbi:MAG: hypothetical protein JWM47_912 [Acidimicrobiales bacterium]|nr:hypothetical protein [Acidimicrobiales bacterium]